MSFKNVALAMAAGLTLTSMTISGAVLAGDMEQIMVQDPYARVSTANSSSGAAFMVLMNHGEVDDRLVSVSSDVAARTELHTHVEDDNGVMKMMQVTDGLPIAAGDVHALARGGDHVMLMGLKNPLAQGDVFSLTLTFENAGEMVIDVPVDLTRKPAHGMSHDHSKMKMKPGG